MTPYEQRLQEDLTALREGLLAVARDVEEAVSSAVRALLTRNRQLAAQVVLGDAPINRAVRELDHRTHRFVAVHLPSAGHLRFVSSVLRLNIELERIGDYAAAIARQALQLPGPPTTRVAADIELMGEQTGRMLHQALRSFEESNPDLARGTIPMAGQLDATFTKVFDDLLREGESGERPVRELFSLLMVFNRLERVAAQAKNICEETIFACTGETKAPKVYRVLFVDQTNTCRSQIAEAVARRTFPESGKYESAGWEPGEEIHPVLLEFMDSKGLPTEGLAPKRLVDTHQDLSQFHVIVSFEGDVSEHVDVVPYRVVPLQWDVARCPGEGESMEEGFSRLYREIAVHVRGLMETLRGEDAS
jgi:phosphate transport system protein